MTDQPAVMSVTGQATSPFEPHTYSLGRERAKANRDFEKPLAPALSLAAGDLALLMVPSRLDSG